MSDENRENKLHFSKSLKETCIEYVVQHFSIFSPLPRMPEELMESIELKILLSYTSKAIIEAAKKNLNTAILILKTPALLDKLGRYDHQSILQLTEPVMSYSRVHYDLMDTISGNGLFTVCNAHPETRKLALEMEEVKSRLSPIHVDQLDPPPRIHHTYWAI